ncbi:hypothetical protein [Microbaculum marinum]|uniref:Uncharacterized protein n=1 Tax=Microbaculum marinum TaxID=1764581 RepID=A0AAW9RQR4_9HYPH
MLHVVTLLWDANDASLSFSRCYDETWVEKLYRGFARNLTVPFRFVCFTERDRWFHAPIEQERIESRPIGYGACIEPYRLDVPMILVGLDTVITGNIDHLAGHCLVGGAIALPKAVYVPDTVCNGVALVPAGHRRVYDDWRGQNDMDWMRLQPHVVLDEIWPGHVVSYKGHVKANGLGDARIVFFHGQEKPHQIAEPWLETHWI